MSARAPRSTEDYRALSTTLLRCDFNRKHRADFFQEAAKILHAFSGCDSVEVHILEGTTYFHCEMPGEAARSATVESEPWQRAVTRTLSARSGPPRDLAELCIRILDRDGELPEDLLMPNGSFWTGGAVSSPPGYLNAITDLEFPSFAVIPLDIGKDRIGILVLKCRKCGLFGRQDIELYEGVAQTLAFALANRRSNELLRERVKELTCLYGIARVAARSDLPLDDILMEIVRLLPPAWLYPEIASARIVVDGKSYPSGDPRDGPQKQIAELTTCGKPRGFVEVVYAVLMPERDEGPFLREERHLIDTIAREVALIIERRESDEEKRRLEGQLRHSDRLATIGQLAAGLAHELNEPLGNILGFAQLAGKAENLATAVRRDLEKISSASLYAREVIRKLMLFARRMPSVRGEVDLNRVIEDGLGLLQARCAQSGIEIVRRLDPAIPKIFADPAQMTQVLVNIAVNAVQAMPGGGILSVETTAAQESVHLSIGDTGTGMSKEVLSQIFMPFFTTKDINEGTGLGLSVAHGIVTSHGGSIEVTSAPGKGTRFTIRLPVSIA